MNRRQETPQHPDNYNFFFVGIQIVRFIILCSGIGFLFAITTQHHPLDIIARSVVIGLVPWMIFMLNDELWVTGAIQHRRRPAYQIPTSFRERKKALFGLLLSQTTQPHQEIEAPRPSNFEKWTWEHYVLPRLLWIALMLFLLNSWLKLLGYTVSFTSSERLVTFWVVVGIVTIATTLVADLTWYWRRRQELRAIEEGQLTLENTSSSTYTAFNLPQNSRISCYVYLLNTSTDLWKPAPHTAFPQDDVVLTWPGLRFTFTDLRKRQKNFAEKSLNSVAWTEKAAWVSIGKNGNDITIHTYDDPPPKHEKTNEMVLMQILSPKDIELLKQRKKRPFRSLDMLLSASSGYGLILHWPENPSK